MEMGSQKIFFFLSIGRGMFYPLNQDIWILASIL